MRSRLLAAGAVLVVWSTSVQAQPVPGTPGTVVPINRDIVFQRAIVGGPDPGVVGFVSAEFGVTGKTVTGAPYSAEAVTESTQTLADGNRIIRKSTTVLYRDSQGRTRREVTLPNIGPWASSAEAAPLIFIHDPVAGVSYVLDVKQKTARKTPGAGAGGFAFSRFAPPPPPPPPPLPPGATAVPAVPATPETLAAPAIAYAPAHAMERIRSKQAQTQSESLGKQIIEGLQADGTRNTLTIPAGEMGNERPITVVNERWYSPDLQTMVTTRHNDPRMGETLYKLTNVRRSEPSPALFEVPPDYTLSTEAPSPMPFRRRLEK